MASPGFDLVRMRAPVTRPLAGVAIIMCYLAASALAGAMGIGRWVNVWHDQAALKMSLYIPAADDDFQADSRAQKVVQVMDLIQNQPAITEARLVPEEEIATLLAPWLGDNADLAHVPVPDLVDITLRKNQDLDKSALMQRIKKIMPEAQLEDHGQWRDAIGRWALLFQILAGLILLAALGCMAAVVGLAARATIDANRELVNIFHLIGAEDAFIISSFRGYFFRLGLLTGCVGAGAAAVSFFLATQLWRFVPPSLSLSAINIKLDPVDYAALALIPALSCLIAIVAARQQVVKNLSELP